MDKLRKDQTKDGTFQSRWWRDALAQQRRQLRDVPRNRIWWLTVGWVPRFVGGVHPYRTHARKLGAAYVSVRIITHM